MSLFEIYPEIQDLNIVIARHAARAMNEHTHKDLPNKSSNNKIPNQSETVKLVCLAMYKPIHDILMCG